MSALGLVADAFGVLFLYSGAAKAASFRRFRGQVAAFGFLPPAVATPASGLLVLVEVGIGALLLSRWKPLAGLGASLALVGLLTAFVAWALAARHDGPCYCFGENDGKISRGTLVRNLLLLALGGATTTLVALEGLPAPLAPERWISLPYSVTAVLLFVGGFQLSSIWTEVRRAV